LTVRTSFSDRCRCVEVTVVDRLKCLDCPPGPKKMWSLLVRCPLVDRLQNSRIFCEREQRGQYSNERSGASVEMARENGACEARALHTRGSRLRRFAPSELGRKHDCFAV